MAIMALMQICIPLYLHFPSLFSLYYVCKRKLDASWYNRITFQGFFLALKPRGDVTKSPKQGNQFIDASWYNRITFQDCRLHSSC